MKKIIPILCLGMLLMTSCIGSKKATNPEVLQGTYLLDLPELISQFDLSEDLQKLNSSLGSLILSKIEVVVKITDSQITIEGPERFNQILEVAKIVASSIIMAIAVWAMRNVLSCYVDGKVLSIAVCGGLIPTGVLIYFILLKILKFKRLENLKKILLRRK